MSPGRHGAQSLRHGFKDKSLPVGTKNVKKEKSHTLAIPSLMSEKTKDQPSAALITNAE